MLAKPSDEALDALARLSQSAEWELVEAWLKDSREGCIAQSLNADNVKSRQAQGGILLLDEIFSITQKAHELSRR